MTEIVKPKYIEEAEKLLGEQEVKGALANDKIVELYADAGHPEVTSDEVPWCAAAVGACLVRANLPSTGSLVARTYAKYGVVSKKPSLYSIGTMRRGNSNWEGHVGFVVDFDANSVWLLGGNQKDRMSVEKYPRKQFIAFSTPKPKAMDIPKAELIADSRRMKFANATQKASTALVPGVLLSWEWWGSFKEFVSDNTGIVLAGTIAVTAGIMWVLNWMSAREYREGRYQPKKQWL